VLHADDPDTGWPCPVIGSGPATTEPSAAEVGREAVAATVATSTSLLPGVARKLWRQSGEFNPGDPGVKGRKGTKPHVTPTETLREESSSVSPRPASPTAAEGPGQKTWMLKRHLKNRPLPTFPGTTTECRGSQLSQRASAL
jgi:hypothetical protein